MQDHERRLAGSFRPSSGFGRRAFVIFLAGFFGGMALIFAGQEGLVRDGSFLGHVSLEGISALEIDRQGLLLYSLKQRLFPACLLVLAAAAGAGSAAVCLFLLWSGFGAGVLLSVLSLRYGIRGVVLFAGGILPQALLLVPAFWLLCGWCATHAGRRTGRAAGRLFPAPADAGALLPVLMFLLGGCVLESYVNPLILHRLLLLFVPGFWSG